MATINKSTKTVGEDVEKREPRTWLVGTQTGAATVASSMEIPQKINNVSAFCPRNPTSGNIHEGIQNTIIILL